MIDRFHKETRYLSNFFERSFTYKGQSFDSVEHAFQMEKTLDPEKRKQIREAESPGDAKKLGKPPEKGGIVNDLRPDWDQIRDDIMLTLVKAKFDQHLDLRTKLLMTKDVDLVEGNFWHDNYWGNCMCTRCRDILGQNKLGKILMGLRYEYRQLPDLVPS